MNKFPLKGILVGSLLSIGFGFISYLVVAFISIRVLEVREATPEALAAVTELMHSNLAYFLSLPVTFVLLSIAGYHAAKRSVSAPYFSATAVALITIGVLDYGGYYALTIYRNYIPIVAGALVGCYWWVREQKLNKALKLGSA